MKHGAYHPREDTLLLSKVLNIGVVHGQFNWRYCAASCARPSEAKKVGVIVLPGVWGVGVFSRRKLDISASIDTLHRESWWWGTVNPDFHHRQILSLLHWDSNNMNHIIYRHRAYILKLIVSSIFNDRSLLWLTFSNICHNNFWMKHIYFTLPTTT